MQKSKDPTRTRITILIFVLILVIAGSLIYLHNHRSTPTITLSETYCNKQGGVCLSYPKTWKMTQTSNSATFTDTPIKTSVIYSPNSSLQPTPCAANTCLFTGLSTVISNGFSNGDDVAGMFHNKQAATYTPEYFLIGTPELILDGLKVGSTIDLKQTLQPTFVNTAKATDIQLLKVVPNSQDTFTSTSTSQAWLASASAQTAEAIVNSARRN